MCIRSNEAQAMRLERFFIVFKCFAEFVAEILFLLLSVVQILIELKYCRSVKPLLQNYLSQFASIGS